MSSPQIQPQICPISGKPSSDEGNTSGFTDSKAQRECFAERYDFSATNATVRDEETGYGYFGARYYDSELLTGWLSVDPMSDKYPSLSPYSYCAWTRPTGGDEHRWIKYNTVNNPVKNLAPNGDSVYTINKRGNISINRELSTKEEYLGKDVLISTKTGSEIDFVEGAISVSSNVNQYYEFVENGQTVSGNETGTYIETNANSDVAEAIYNFCILNTDHIEFSLLQTNSKATNWIISTSHKHEMDPFSTAMGYAFAAGGMFYSHRHHHPYNGIDCKKASDGDKTFMRRVNAMMNKTKGYTPSFGISLKCRTNHQISSIQ